MTKEEVHRKYKDRYVSFDQEPFWSVKERREYRILKVFKVIRENTTLGQDVGTEREYTR